MRGAGIGIDQALARLERNALLLRRAAKEWRTSGASVVVWLLDVADHYNACFNLGLSPGEKSDLVQFLRSR